jgi:translation initiation factor 2 alpha subunit (eIF-2alpha)
VPGKQALLNQEAAMDTLRIEKQLSRSAIWLAGAIALVIAGCTSSGAVVRQKKALTAANSAQHEKPVKMRYYGGPKYPRYPE